MRKVATAARLLLKDLLRRRIALLLLFIVPALFDLVVLVTTASRDIDVMLGSLSDDVALTGTGLDQLALVMFDDGTRTLDERKLSLVFLGAFYPVLLNTIFGVRNVDPKLFEAAAMLGCRGSSVFRRVVLPAALPSIFTGLRLGLGFAWVVIVVGEMTGVPQGLGAVIMDARTLSRTDLVICGMIVIGIAGFLSDKAITWLNRRLLRWNPQATG